MSRVAVGDRFPAIRVETLRGAESLSPRWRDGPLVVSFMRHFGCTFCREHLDHLKADYDAICAAGGDVVAIFQYGAQATADFRASRQLPFECVGDPLLAAYAALDVRRGKIGDLYGWEVIKRTILALRTTGMNSSPQGADIAQLPGTFVVAPNGRLALAHYSRNSADNPPMKQVLDAVRAAAGVAV